MLPGACGLGKDRQRVRQLTCLPLRWLLETSILMSSHPRPQLHVYGGQSRKSPREWEERAGPVLSLSGTEGITP